MHEAGPPQADDAPLHGRMAQFVNWLIAWRWPLLVVAAVVAAFAYSASEKLAFDRAIESMFAVDDPLLAPYQLLKRTFGGNEVVLVAYTDEQFLTSAGMRRLEALSDRVAKAPGVAAVLSLRSLMGDDVTRDDPLARRYRELFSGYTHRINPETKVAAVAVVCLLDPAARSAADRRATIEALREAVAPLPGGTVAGEPVMIVDGFRYIEEDGERLGLITTTLLMATIAICFRSIRWMIIPLVVVQWTLVVTRATLVWSHLRLSMVSSMLTAIVAVVGVAAVIHLLVGYREQRARGLAPRESLAFTGALLGDSIFWACTTDAVGFASLMATRVGPVQDFGLMMAIGSLFVIVGMMLTTPGLALAGRLDRDPRHAWGEAQLGGGLQRVLDLVKKYPRTLGAITVAITAASLIGSGRLEIESDFTRNFRDNSPIVESYAFVERDLGGAGVWDIILPAPQQLDWPFLARVLELERRLRQEVPGLTKVLSLADSVEAASPVDLDHAPQLVQLLGVDAALGTMRQRMPVFVAALVGEDPEQPGSHYLRIMLRARERQPSSEKRALIETVQRISREEFPEAQVTGYFVLLTHLIDSLLRDQWVAFAVATTGIGLMILLAFRSLPFALIALVPNALPVLVVTGAMGFLGFKINMGAVMIAAVSMGLSIDSSIHYIDSYRTARRAGRTVDESLEAVQQSVGRALFFATLALMVGFSSLCWSEFVPTIYFGALVSLTMLGGLAGNIALLPLLILWVERRVKL